jgi:hypothetical protein
LLGISDQDPEEPSARNAQVLLACVRRDELLQGIPSSHGIGGSANPNLYVKTVQANPLVCQPYGRDADGNWGDFPVGKVLLELLSNIR